MTADLVTDVLTMAWFRKRPNPGLIVHSDWSISIVQWLFNSGGLRKVGLLNKANYLNNVQP